MWEDFFQIIRQSASSVRNKIICTTDYVQTVWDISTSLNVSVVLSTKQMSCTQYGTVRLHKETQKQKPFFHFSWMFEVSSPVRQYFASWTSGISISSRVCCNPSNRIQWDPDMTWEVKSKKISNALVFIQRVVKDKNSSSVYNEKWGRCSSKWSSFSWINQFDHFHLQIYLLCVLGSQAATASCSQ